LNAGVLPVNSACGQFKLKKYQTIFWNGENRKCISFQIDALLGISGGTKMGKVKKPKSKCQPT
jgi:hypothetical protein